MKIVINGNFDPLHSGHIAFFRKVIPLGDLIIILNNDAVVCRKKGYVFMGEKERQTILENIKGVSKVVIAGKPDNNAKAIASVLKTIRPDVLAISQYSSRTDELITICQELGIEVRKFRHKNNQSSSKLVRSLNDNLKGAV